MGTPAFQHDVVHSIIMDSKCLQEYVLWLRIKYLLRRYEIVDNTLLLKYERGLIAVLKEEIGNEFLWIENCT